MFGITESNLTFYGALLGLVAFVLNVLGFFASAWPRLHLAPAEDRQDRVLLVLTNASKRPLQIKYMWQICRRNGGLDVFPKASDLGLTIEIAADWIESRWRGQLMLYVPPEGVDQLRVTQRNKGADAIIVLWWHRFWFLPICLPSFVRISSEDIEDMQRGSRHRNVQS